VFSLIRSAEYQAQHSFPAMSAGDGIRECDFGVVIFSPNFLRKNWTQEEFNGLKALQTTERKVILPILHNLTIDELKAKWPIEAGKLSISSSEGIPAIVKAIHFAVGVDRQNKDFDRDALNKAFGDFQSAKQIAKINDDLSKVREGCAVKAHDAAIAEIESWSVRTPQDHATWDSGFLVQLFCN
jgi:hypothetical protein